MAEDWGDSSAQDFLSACGLGPAGALYRGVQYELQRSRPPSPRQSSSCTALTGCC